MRLFALLAALCACHRGPGVIGQRLDPPRPVPEFTATNSDGAARTRADLIGKPTVLWFYPAADTPG